MKENVGPCSCRTENWPPTKYEEQSLFYEFHVPLKCFKISKKSEPVWTRDRPFFSLVLNFCRLLRTALLYKMKPLLFISQQLLNNIIKSKGKVLEKDFNIHPFILFLHLNVESRSIHFFMWVALKQERWNIKCLEFHYDICQDKKQSNYIYLVFRKCSKTQYAE